MSKQENKKTGSFSLRIKEEITSINPRSISERQAVIAGVFCTAMSAGDKTPAHGVRLNKECSDYIIRLLKKEGIKATKELMPNGRNEYWVNLPEDYYEEFDRVYGFCFTEGGLEVLSNDTAFARSFLRGAFISCGYCSDPNKTYRIELHLHNQGIVNIVYFMLEEENIASSITVRDQTAVLYFGNGDAVSDFINLIGASNSMLEFENIRANREVKANVTRMFNCDTGNLARQTEAGAKRSELIEKLLNSPLAGSLTPQLLEAARVHQANPGASITELGKLMNPPLGKSGMNHRLTKLIELANSLD